MSKANSGLFFGTIGFKSFSINILKDKSNKASLIDGRKHKQDISNPVINAVRTGSALKKDHFHSFPDIVDNYVIYAKKFVITGGDAKKRLLFQLSGSLNGQRGIFEWIVDPDKTKGVTHRRFIKGGVITGCPNQHSGRTGE